jgi:hypothetical protein
MGGGGANQDDVDVDETAFVGWDAWAMGGPEHGDDFLIIGRLRSAHSLDQAVTSLFRPGQTNLEE